MNQNNQQGFNPTFKESVNMAYGVMSVLAMGVIPFLKRYAGREGYGLRAFFALILMLVIGSLGYAPEMYVYAACWLVMVAFRRLQTMCVLRKGYVIHSRSWGESIFRVRLPGFTKAQTGQAFEVVTCILAAFAVGPLYPVLGGFFVAGAVSLAFVGAVHAEADRRKLQSLADLRIEQSWLAARCRDDVERY